MDVDDFIPLVGKQDDAPEVVKVLKTLDVKTPPKLKRGDLYAHVKFPEDGLVLAFRESADPKSSKLVLAAIQIYSDAEPEFTTFAGRLPRGLLFTDTRTEVRKKLGKPSRSKDLLRKDFWDRDGHVLTVRYAKDTGQIQSVSLDMPMKF